MEHGTQWSWHSRTDARGLLAAGVVGHVVAEILPSSKRPVAASSDASASRTPRDERVLRGAAGNDPRAPMVRGRERSGAGRAISNVRRRGTGAGDRRGRRDGRLAHVGSSARVVVCGVRTRALRRHDAVARVARTTYRATAHRGSGRCAAARARRTGRSSSRDRTGGGNAAGVRRGDRHCGDHDGEAAARRHRGMRCRRDLAGERRQRERARSSLRAPCRAWRRIARRPCGAE